MRFPFLPALSSSTLLVASLSVIACGGSSPAAATPADVAPPPAITTPPPSASLPKGADKPESDKVTWKKDASPKSCHGASKGADLTAGVTAIASRCIDTTKMHQLGQPTTGEGQASQATMVKTIPLAAKANHCYRVFGLAEPTVTDFDIAIMDSNSKSAGEDGTDTNEAVVLEDGSICFSQDDAANVNAAVASGKGKWSVEIWSD